MEDAFNSPIHLGDRSVTIQAGLWIDHSKAVTVILHNESIDLSIIDSQAEYPPQTNGDFRALALYGNLRLMSEAGNKGRFDSRIAHFFDKVFRRIKPASELVLMGPGETRKQFINYLIQQKSPIKLRECMPAGLMSNSEITRHVCRVFNRIY